MDHFRWNKKTKFLKQDFQAFYDVVIIGGGVMGCSVAYWLAQRIYRGMKIAVIERDPTVRIKSKMRQQIIRPMFTGRVLNSIHLMIFYFLNCSTGMRQQHYLLGV